MKPYDDFPIGYPLPIYFIKTADGNIKVGINAHTHPPVEIVEKCHIAMSNYFDEADEEYIDRWNEESAREFDEELRTSHHKQKERAKESGYIYLIESAGLHKIGRAKSLDRIKTYRTENPHDIKVLKTVLVQDYKLTEKEIVEWSNPYVVRGKEWLKLTDEQLGLLIGKIESYE